MGQGPRLLWKMARRWRGSLSQAELKALGLGHSCIGSRLWVLVGPGHRPRV